MLKNIYFMSTQKERSVKTKITLGLMSEFHTNAYTNTYTETQYIHT